MTLAAGAAQIKEPFEEGQHPPTITTTAIHLNHHHHLHHHHCPPPPEAQRLFNKSLLQPFAVLRLAVVGSMGATNQQGVPGLATAQKKKKENRIPVSPKNSCSRTVGKVGFVLTNDTKLFDGAFAPDQHCRCLFVYLIPRVQHCLVVCVFCPFPWNRHCHSTNKNSPHSQIIKKGKSRKLSHLKLA